jgi:predicted membrane protein
METPKFHGRVILGLVLIILGGLFFLSNYGIFIIPDNFYSWEYFFILIGILFLLLARNKTAGAVFLFIGLFNLYPDLWPIILVLIGLRIVFGRKERASLFSKNFSKTEPGIQSSVDIDSKDLLESISIFGGGSKIVNSDNFRGGNIVSIFGGSEINLNNCKLAEGDNTIEITAIFGGTTLIVPNDWKVVLDVLPIFGGFGDKRIKDPNKTFQEGRTLIIKGIVLFGGGEIKTSFI